MANGDQFNTIRIETLYSTSIIQLIKQDTLILIYQGYFFC